MVKKNFNKNGEKGAALAVAIIILAILSVVSLTALSFSASEARIAQSELRRSQSFYAAVSGIEKMTHDFSNLFRLKMTPVQADLDAIADDHPPELLAEGFEFDQDIREDAVKLAKLREIQGISDQFYPRVNIPDGPYAGLFASIIPYKMTSIASAALGRKEAEVALERDFNNYLVPLFQFGVFGTEDLEFAPGPFTTFNGRIHTNGNLYALRNTKFLSRVTTAGELVRNATRGGDPNTASGNTNVWIEVNGMNININKGSVEAGGGAVGGPYINGTAAGDRGYHPGSPFGIANPSWEAQSMAPADGTPGKFGGMISTQSTGSADLKLPIQLEGNSPMELIKRGLTTDSPTMKSSRYMGKSVVRILIDDEAAGFSPANEAGIPAGKGVMLSNFYPVALGGGNALRRVDNGGSYIDASTIKHRLPDNSIVDAGIVRGIKNTHPESSSDSIARGSGINGRILIEITKPDGTTIDVTEKILSMGMTEGEPNGIIYLQRPLWAAFMQTSRDRLGGDANLVSLTTQTQSSADGEIIANPSFDPARGFITGPIASLQDDASDITRESIPAGAFNQIVPINIYNVREGWFRTQMDQEIVWERGITSAVEINMKNLARWFDGAYDTNLLSGTQAVSTNIKGTEGYVVYISDRRGDRVKGERTSAGANYTSTNGMADNEDIYGPNNTLDEGEDIINTGFDTALGVNKAGSLQKDIAELPDTGAPFPIPPDTSVPPAPPVTLAQRRAIRANMVMSWTNPSNYFRRSIRLFNGETLSTTGASGKLSPTKGITIATENMVYLLGNYNTTGISSIPGGGSTINNGTGYLGPQIPASIACDAIFPLSKTWFDGLSALYPEGSSLPMGLAGDDYRRADANLPGISESTSVRAAILSGTTTSVKNGSPGRNIDGDRMSGGIVNFPRFLEIWNLNGNTSPWNYAGSFAPLFRSTQAVSQWENDTSVIYMPPRRNWSFDITFRNPAQIPPGTPFFQYVAATGFRPLAGS